MGLFDRKAGPAESIEQRITSWLSEERVSHSPLPSQPGADFALLLDYPPGTPAAKIHLVRPSGRHLVALGMGVQLSPPHQQALAALSPTARDRAIRVLRKTAFAGGQVGFGPVVENGIPVRWTLDVLVFDDALSRHALHSALRALYTKHLEVIETLNLELGTVAAGEAKAPPAGGLTGYG